MIVRVLLVACFAAPHLLAVPPEMPRPDLADGGVLLGEYWWNKPTAKAVRERDPASDRAWWKCRQLIYRDGVYSLVEHSKGKPNAADYSKTFRLKFRSGFFFSDDPDNCPTFWLEKDSMRHAQAPMFSKTPTSLDNKISVDPTMQTMASVPTDHKTHAKNIEFHSPAMNAASKQWALYGPSTFVDPNESRIATTTIFDELWPRFQESLKPADFLQIVHYAKYRAADSCYPFTEDFIRQGKRHWAEAATLPDETRQSFVKSALNAELQRRQEVLRQFGLTLLRQMSYRSSWLDWVVLESKRQLDLEAKVREKQQ